MDSSVINRSDKYVHPHYNLIWNPFYMTKILVSHSIPATCRSPVPFVPLSNMLYFMETLVTMAETQHLNLIPVPSYRCTKCWGQRSPPQLHTLRWQIEIFHLAAAKAELCLNYAWCAQFISTWLRVMSVELQPFTHCSICKECVTVLAHLSSNSTSVKAYFQVPLGSVFNSGLSG